MNDMPRRSLSRSDRHSARARTSETGKLDIAHGVVSIDWAYLRADRWRYGLNYGELADPSGYGRIPKDRSPIYTRCDLLEQFQTIFRSDYIQTA